jgi:hypothetical protein
VSKTKVFDKALTTSYAATTPLMMAAGRVTMDFLLTVATEAAVQWYLEFTDDNPNNASTQWFRELAEEDAGGGVVAIPLVVRTFKESSATLTNLQAGTFAGSAQFARTHKFFRLQIRASSGSVTRAQIWGQFGVAAVTPAG